AFGDIGDDLNLRELAAGHLHMDLVNLEVKKSREHRRVTAQPHRVAFVVAETKVGGEPAAAHHRLHGTVENVDEAIRIFAVRATCSPPRACRAGRAPAARSGAAARPPGAALPGIHKTID